MSHTKKYILMLVIDNSGKKIYYIYTEYVDRSTKSYANYTYHVINYYSEFGTDIYDFPFDSRIFSLVGHLKTLKEENIATKY